jgi:hypothetical protein
MVEKVMSVRKLTFGLLVAAALLAGQRGAGAQEHLPVADPFHFDPDFRWFEPVYDADLQDMKPKKRASVGWYGGYDRLYLYSSRPEVDILREGATNDYAAGMDAGWGDRIELGYMLENGHGWSGTMLSFGASAFDGFLQERQNRLNTIDNIGPDEDDDSGTFDRFGQLLPSADRNLNQYNERLYLLDDSINVFDATSFELNKTWRMEPYHYGGMLEPMIGLRFVSLTDRYQEESYVRGVDVDDNPTEIFFSDRSTSDNKMFGGQLGARYFKYRDRFMFSGEFKVFALANFQNHRTISEQTTTTYDDAAIDGEVISELVFRNNLRYVDNDEFVVGFDTRVDVSYQLTRHFQIRTGMQLIDLGRGIWRGQITDRTDQSVLAVGATFGIALNR